MKFLNNLSVALGVPKEELKSLKKNSSLGLKNLPKNVMREFLYRLCELRPQKYGLMKEHLPAYRYRLSLKTKEEVRRFWEKYNRREIIYNFDEFKMEGIEDLSHKQMVNTVIRNPKTIAFLKETEGYGAIKDFSSLSRNETAALLADSAMGVANLSVFEKRGLNFLRFCPNNIPPKNWKFDNTKEGFLEAMRYYRIVDIDKKFLTYVSWKEIAKFRLEVLDSSFRSMEEFKKLKYSDFPVVGRINLMMAEMMDRGTWEEDIL